MKFFYVFHDEHWIPMLKKQVPGCTLLYVGKNNLTKEHENVYVCKDLANNIEQYPQFLSFTAWYAISKNRLELNTEDGNEESIAIFEYDCLPESDTSLTKLISHSKQYDVLGIHIDYANFYVDVKREILDGIINKLDLIHPANFTWYKSSNFVMKRTLLDEFVDIFWPFALTLNNLDPNNIKYYHERVFASFLAKKMVTKTTATVCKGFKHFELRSHNVSGFFLTQVPCIFVTYGDQKFRHSVSRISGEMKSLCENQLVYTESDIDNSCKMTSKVDWMTTKGGGYWLWKPYILAKSIESLENNQCILYCDSGSCIDDAEILKENIDRFIKSDEEMYAFKMKSEDRNELQWTSRKVLDMFKLSESDVNDGQIHATTFLLKNTPLVKSIIQKWFDLASTKPELFTDEYNSQGEYGKHRNDQSVLSCILKQVRSLNEENREKIVLATDVIENEKNSFGIFKAHAHGDESCAISYALRYRDLKEAFYFSKVLLATHYEEHGKDEGRQYCSCFKFEHSFFKNHQKEIDWKAYKIGFTSTE